MIDFDVNGDLAIAIDNVDGKFVVKWFDYVANVHSESYDSLSVALLRAACLARLVEKDGGVFEHFDDEYVAFAEKVLGEAVVPG